MLRRDLDQLKDEIALLEAQLLANNTSLPDLSMDSELEMSQPQTGGTQDALKKYGNTIAASERSLAPSTLATVDSLELPLDLSDGDEEETVKPKGKRKSFQFKSNGLIDDSDEDSEDSDDEVIPSSLNNSPRKRRLSSHRSKTSPAAPAVTKGQAKGRPEDEDHETGTGHDGRMQSTMEGSVQSTMESVEEQSVSLLLPQPPPEVEDTLEPSAPTADSQPAQTLDLSSPPSPSPPPQQATASTDSQPAGRRGRKRTAASQRASKKNSRNNKAIDLSQDDSDVIDSNVSSVEVLKKNKPQLEVASGKQRKRKLSSVTPEEASTQSKKTPVASGKQPSVAAFLKPKGRPTPRTSPRMEGESSESPGLSQRQPGMASPAPSSKLSTASESPNLSSFSRQATNSNTQDSVLLMAEISPALQRKPAVVEVLSPGGRNLVTTGLRKVNRRSASSTMDTPASCSTATADSSTSPDIKQESTSPTPHTPRTAPAPKASPHTTSAPVVKQELPSPSLSTSTADSSMGRTPTSSDASPAAVNFPQKPQWIFVTSGIKSVKVKVNKDTSV